MDDIHHIIVIYPKSNMLALCNTVLAKQAGMFVSVCVAISLYAAWWIRENGAGGVKISRITLATFVFHVKSGAIKQYLGKSIHIVGESNGFFNRPDLVNFESLSLENRKNSFRPS